MFACFMRGSTNTIFHIRVKIRASPPNALLAGITYYLIGFYRQGNFINSTHNQIFSVKGYTSISSVLHWIITKSPIGCYLHYFSIRILIYVLKCGFHYCYSKRGHMYTDYSQPLNQCCAIYTYARSDKKVTFF